MTIVKTRKVGNSVTITIPKEFDVPTGQEYKVYKTSDGTLLLSPSQDNLLEGATDKLVQDTLIKKLSETIDRNLQEMKAGNYYTLNELETQLFDQV